MIFDDQTKPEKIDPPTIDTTLEDSDPATIVDGSLSAALQDALARRPDPTTLPLDTGLDDPAERTMRSNVPQFEGHDEDTGPRTDPAVVLDPLDAPTTSSNIAPREQTSHHDRTSAPANAAVSRAPRVSPIGEAVMDVEHAEAQAERTMIDLASALGMAPEQVDLSLGRAAPEVTEPAQPSATPQAIDLTPLLPDEDEPGKSKGPHQGLAGEDIQQLAVATDALARTIPFLLGSVLVIATIAITVMMFGGRSQNQQHIELRFLSLAGPSKAAAVESEQMTRLNLETTPSGLLVLHHQKILGKTPLEIDLGLEIDEKVGVELSGPYYDRWLGEVTREATGEYNISVTLTEKRR